MTRIRRCRVDRRDDSRRPCRWAAPAPPHPTPWSATCVVAEIRRNAARRRSRRRDRRRAALRARARTRTPARSADAGDQPDQLGAGMAARADDAEVLRFSGSDRLGLPLQRRRTRAAMLDAALDVGRNSSRPYQNTFHLSCLIAAVGFGVIEHVDRIVRGASARTARILLAHHLPDRAAQAFALRVVGTANLSRYGKPSSSRQDQRGAVVLADVGAVAAACARNSPAASLRPKLDSISARSRSRSTPFQSRRSAARARRGAPACPSPCA